MKTHSKIVLATGAVLLGGVVLAGTTYARGGFGHGGFGGHRGGPAMMLEQLDSDGDRQVTLTEAEGVVDGRCAGADLDGDGALGLEEFQPILVELMRPRIVDSFQFLDEDGDAKLTREEIDRPLGRMLAHLDRDDDGSISLDELQSHRRGFRHRGGGHHGGDHHGDGERGDSD
jgi:hypothetical protein